MNQKVIPVILGNFLAMSSVMAILPVIGPIIRELGLAEWHSGIIVSVTGLFVMLMSRYWGKMSDVKGRKKTILICSVGYILFYFIYSFFLDFALQNHLSVFLVLLVFIGLRALLGVFYAGIYPVNAALIADMTTKGDRTKGMALLGASSGFGMIAGPAMASLFSKQSLTLPLYVASMVAVFIAFLVLFTYPQNIQRNLTKKPKIKLLDPRLRLPLLTALITNSCIMMGNMVIGFFGIDVLHLTAQQAAQNSGYTMVIVGVCMILSQIVIGSIKSISPILWIIGGIFFAAIGYSTIILLQSIMGLFIGYGLAAMGFGVVFPAFQSLASQSVGVDEQGIAAGSISATNGLAMMVIPIVSTVIYEFNPLYPYIIATTLLVALFSYVLWRQSYLD